MLTEKDDVENDSMWKSGVFNLSCVFTVYGFFNLKWTWGVWLKLYSFSMWTDFFKDALFRNLKKHTRTWYCCSMFWRYVGRLD